MSRSIRPWALAALLWMLGSALAAQPSLPNILVIMTDDQSWPHASAYGSKVARTPGFDRIARQGVLFSHAFVSAPSCGPSRASLLTGQEFYRLGPTAMNHAEWQANLVPITDRLRDAGYAVGFSGKGWAPGEYRAHGRTVDPVGERFNARTTRQPASDWEKVDYAANFAEFLKSRTDEGGKPFFFWVGINEPHRPFFDGVAARNGKRLDASALPPFLPPGEIVRNDVADYGYEIEWADRHVAAILDLLQKQGRLSNTLVVFTSDNGMPFPRAKGQLYDSGTRVPTAVAWPAAFKGARKVDDIVRLPDLGATILEAAQLPIGPEVTGRSLLSLLKSNRSGRIEPDRDFAVMGMERHFPGSRAEAAGYPSRAIRTHRWLYIRNLAPTAGPVGDAIGRVWPDDDPTRGYGDVDGSPTKTAVAADKGSIWHARAFGQRPAEELYDVRSDPAQLRNLAADRRYARTRAQLASRMDQYLSATGDPRALGKGHVFDEVMRRFSYQHPGDLAPASGGASAPR